MLHTATHLKLRCCPPLAALGCLLVAVSLLGCEKDPRAARKAATDAVERLGPLVARDAKQIRDGLPKGAAELAKRLDVDPGSNLAGLKKAIQKSRSAVHDLAVAKSTFFLFMNPAGVVLRSEADPDLAADKSLTDAIPEAKKILDPKAGLVEVYGEMDGLRGVRKGADLAWVAGHPVVHPKTEKLAGAFVTGWSLRGYAKYLEDDTRRYLATAQEDKGKAPPLAYVFIVKGTNAYGAPVTPDINAETVSKLDVLSKAQDGMFQTDIKLEGRKFVIAAKREPALGEGVGIAVMLSQF